MPRLHLAESPSSSGGPGSALQNVRNLQPRARRSNSSFRGNEKSGGGNASKSAGGGADSVDTIGGSSAGRKFEAEDLSDFDQFDFGGFEYDELQDDGRGSIDKKVQHCGGGGVESMEFTPPRNPSSSSEEQKASQPPPSSSSSSDSSNITDFDTSIHSSARNPKQKPTYKKKLSAQRNVVSISPKQVPTVPSRKIAGSSLSSDNKQAAPNQNSNGIQSAKQETSKNRKVDEIQGGGKNTIQTNANGKKADNLRSREKNHAVNQQRKQKVTFKADEKSSHLREGGATKKGSGKPVKGAKSTSTGKSARKNANSKEHQKKAKMTNARRKPQDSRNNIFLDESDEGDNDGLEDTDDEVSQNEKKSETSIHSTKERQPLQEGIKSEEQLQVLPLRAIAIDNRALPTLVGDSMYQYSFMSHIPDFIEGALEKGVLSSTLSPSTRSDGVERSTIIASLTHGGRTSQSTQICQKNSDSSVVPSVVAHASYLFEARGNRSNFALNPRSSKDTAIWLSDFLTPINHCFDNDCVMVDNRSGSKNGHPEKNGKLDEEIRHTTKGFAAEDSWSYFGDLVDAIGSKLSRAGPQRHPCSVSLFTTDSAMFSDTKSTFHLNGLENFWKRISSAFQSNIISSVTITVVETTSIRQMMDALHSNYMNENSPDPSIPNRLHVIQCVNDIRQRMKELSEEQTESSSWIFDDSANALNADSAIPINLQFEFMEGNSLSFQSLLQMWVKESFTHTYATGFASQAGYNGVQGRISFDLPETLDGIMCSISLDLQYTILPKCITSSSTIDLVKDMNILSRLLPSSVEVVQTISVASVDASLMYGVPMSARAGLENDISRYNEMKMLVRQLWTYLGRNDLALVLRARSHKDENQMEELNPVSEGCFSEQLFLLICQEAVQKPSPILDDASNLDRSRMLDLIPDKSRKGEAPCHGILYRYATKDQILHFMNEEATMDEDENENSAEMSENYLDYIERSLEMLVNTNGLNPLLAVDLGKDIDNGIYGYDRPSFDSHAA